MIVADDAGLTAIRDLVRQEVERVAAQIVARMGATEPEWLNAKGAAAFVGCNVRTLVRKGAPRHGTGRLARYRRDELERWMRGAP